MIRHRKIHTSRSLRACALALATTALALTPTANASTGAVDQYTEQPPTGPAGSGHDLSTGGTTQSPPRGGSSGGSSGSSADGAPAAPPTAPAVEPTLPAESSSSAAPEPPSGKTDSDRGAKGSAGARGFESTVSALTGANPIPPAAVPTSSGDDGTTLPIVDYPVTSLVLILTAVALGGLAVAGGIGAYRWRREPESPPA
jgi:hypothetical protein